MTSTRWTPRVTVSALARRANGDFLIIEERTRLGLRLNQPSGHLERGESLVQAVIRETLEETRWNVVPTALVGIYRWRAPESDTTFLRVSFACELRHESPELPLDRGIVRVHWMSAEALAAQSARHRAPSVSQSVEDYLSGRRIGLDLLTDFVES